MTKHYVTLSFVVEGPNLPSRLPLNELVYRGLYGIDGRAEASDVALSCETEAKHDLFDKHQNGVQEKRQPSVLGDASPTSKSEPVTNAKGNNDDRS